MKCPECGYERQPTDQGPDYECPSCGINYVKVNLSKNHLPPTRRPIVIEKPKPQANHRTTKAPGLPGYWEMVFDFRIMVTTAVLRVIFWLGSAVLIVAGFVMLVDKHQTLPGLATIILTPIAWRMIIEMAMLPFSIHESLEAVRKLLEEQARPKE